MQDDVLAVEDGKAIAINVKETEAIVAKTNTVREAAKLCYEIGNRHAPLFFGENFDEIVMFFTISRCWSCLKSYMPIQKLNKENY